MHWIRAEPRACNPLRDMLVGRGRARQRLLHKSRDDELKHERVQGYVQHKCSRDTHSPFRALELKTEDVRAAQIRLVHHAAEDNGARNAHAPLGPPVNLARGKVARLHTSKHFVVVDGVDDHMAEGEREEHTRRKPAREEEAEGGERGVENQVGIPGEVHFQRRHQSLRGWLRQSPMRPHDPSHQLIGDIHRHDGLKQEWDQERRWKRVLVECRAQTPLHRICLESEAERLHLAERSPGVRLHPQPRIDLICHVVGHIQV
mmetsp:Transcript_30295/g.87359  ORF Transcript_30295/g.87359 Transcript_30295/m.87359 type:complete len:260 (+) Transcript_30295:260-1039(+)